MTEMTHEKMTVVAPLEIAAAVIESAGYELFEEVEGMEVVGFALPHCFDGACEAVVEFLSGVGQLQISTALIRGHVNPILHTGLVMLLNELNLMMPGVKFTFEPDEETGDEIEISASCFVFDEIQLEEHVKLMLRYLEEALKMSLPAIYTYVTQRTRARVNTNGVVTQYGPSLSVQDVLNMIERGQTGRA